MTKNYKNIDVQEVITPMLAFAAANCIMLAYRTYKDYLSKAARYCTSFQGRDRSLCRTKYTITALNKQKSILQSGLSKCNKAKDPDKCREKIKKQILKIDEKIKLLKSQYTELTNAIKKGEEKIAAKRQDSKG